MSGRGQCLVNGVLVQWDFRRAVSENFSWKDLAFYYGDKRVG
jgi:hypothetical protein